MDLQEEREKKARVEISWQQCAVETAAGQTGGKVERVLLLNSGLHCVCADGTQAGFSKEKENMLVKVKSQRGGVLMQAYFHLDKRLRTPPLLTIERSKKWRGGNIYCIFTFYIAQPRCRPRCDVYTVSALPVQSQFLQQIMAQFHGQIFSSVLD